MNRFSGQYFQGDCFEKPLHLCNQTIETKEQWDFSSISIIKLCSIIDSLETSDEQTKFYFRRYSTVACYKLSQFNSRVFILDLNEIVIGYKKLRSFQGTQVNLSVLLEKTDISYQSRNS